LDDFENAIKHDLEEGPCVLLAEIHLACFRAFTKILKDPPSQHLIDEIDLFKCHLHSKLLTHNTWDQYATIFALEVSSTLL
jgi:hypothetical protein